MGDVKGFIKVARQKAQYRPVCERIMDYKEIAVPRSDAKSSEQASRCMDCGTPFCHWGCSVGNFIPEWNDAVYAGRWKEAYEMLDSTNNLPEVTGRICPALCEYSCVLGINDDPVTISENELSIIEYAFKNGFVQPRPPKKRTGKKMAVIGSGPAGLSCAAQLNKAGHTVTVFEKDDKIGGILRYGIPDFKLEKWILDRRIALWENEGVRFTTGVNVGVDYQAKELLEEFDAVALAGGSRQPRDLRIEGRDLKGIHFAMDYLIQSNRRISGEKIPESRLIDAKGKRVVVIGGGDTGSDCVGTAHRQGAACVVQVELLEQPPECRTGKQPWPLYPALLKTSTSHQEGGERHWSVLTKKIIGENGRVSGLSCVKVEFSSKKGLSCPIVKEVTGSAFDIGADLVILAVGFVHPVHDKLLADLGVAFDGRGNVKADDSFKTANKKVFAAGDMRRGQSLIVWAISEGRKAARAIDLFLMGSSKLLDF
ncbi:MAG: glutamate synthase subunit beta [Candidatus Omnitrophota bacterium]